MNKRINVAVIGVGRLGSAHARVYKAISECKRSFG